MPLAYRDYLGDSVYAGFDGYNIVLTTENGYGPTNTIALEPQVLRTLDNYRARLNAELAARNAVQPAEDAS
jgi:hypothetical protein